jgi:hypothetical protein
MDYKQNLINKIKNSDTWPDITRPDFLSELNILADEMYNKNTLEGGLASLLIYHQLCEEMVKVLINCSEFYIQLAVFPAEITFKKNSKRMFGQLIDELEKGINFDKKTDFIDKCQAINTIRIKIVHRLTLKSSVYDILLQVREAKKIFDEIFKLYVEIYDNYRLNFHSFNKDID